MAITITQADRQTNASWQSIKTFTQSTATVPQVIQADTDIVHLGMGTASGDNRNNLYILGATTTASGREGDAVEGQEIILRTAGTGTGEAACFIEMATGRVDLNVGLVLLGGAGTGTASEMGDSVASATGNFVFSNDGHFCVLKFMNSVWHPMLAFGCTHSTGT